HRPYDNPKYNKRSVRMVWTHGQLPYCEGVQQCYQHQARHSCKHGAPAPIRWVGLCPAVGWWDELWDEFECTRKGDYQGGDYGQEAGTPKSGFERLREEQRPAAKREQERQYESKKLVTVDGARFGLPAGHCLDITCHGVIPKNETRNQNECLEG